MKKFCFAIVLSMMITVSGFANTGDPVLETDTLSADRTLIVKLNDWQAETIKVTIRNQAGKTVLVDKLDGHHTAIKGYLLNDLSAGMYQIELKSKSEVYAQQFTVADEQIRLAEGGITSRFRPALKQPKPQSDITMQVKEQWYQRYHK